MFKEIFLEILRASKLPRPRNVLGSRRFKGSTGLQGREGGKMNLLPDVHRADPTYPEKLKTLKNMQSGLFLLNDQEVQTVKEIFGISDLEQRKSRNLGNTGITFYIADSKYYIKK